MPMQSQLTTYISASSGLRMGLRGLDGLSTGGVRSYVTDDPTEPTWWAHRAHLRPG